MKCKLDRDTLIAPLQLVTNVIERRQTLPILANVCLDLKQEAVTLIGTDLEVEISQEVAVAKVETTGSCTVTARKLLDICRALPEGSSISLSGQGAQLKLQSGRSRYTLQTLPAGRPALNCPLPRYAGCLRRRHFRWRNKMCGTS